MLLWLATPMSTPAISSFGPKQCLGLVSRWRPFIPSEAAGKTKRVARNYLLQYSERIPQKTVSAGKFVLHLFIGYFRCSSLKYLLLRKTNFAIVIQSPLKHTFISLPGSICYAYH